MAQPVLTIDIDGTVATVRLDRPELRDALNKTAVDLVITTARLGRFFAEAGQPVTGRPQPPAAGDVARFTAVAAQYGHTLGTPEENAAVGIQMPKFAGGQ
jgi:hypothetical protein